MSDDVKAVSKADSIKEMELKLKQLEIEAKELELQDLRERVDERKLKREMKGQRSKTNGATLRTIANNDIAAQNRCNHKKGGNGPNGVVGGQGDDAQYSVLKHQFLNGDTWVRCLRCGKTWKPPIESEFYFDADGKVVAPQDGKFDAAKFNDAKREYQEALSFQTRNTASGSIMFKFSDGGKYFREDVMKNTNLR